MPLIEETGARVCGVIFQGRECRALQATPVFGRSQ